MKFEITQIPKKPNTEKHSNTKFEFCLHFKFPNLAHFSVELFPRRKENENPKQVNIIFFFFLAMRLEVGTLVTLLFTLKHSKPGNWRHCHVKILKPICIFTRLRTYLSFDPDPRADDEYFLEEKVIKWKWKTIT